MKYNFDCVIIGSGIAGMTAAIYLKRASCNVIIIDNSAPGGLLNKITSIENYPGFLSISGPDLAYKIYEQVNNLGIEVRYGNVLSLESNLVKTDIEEFKTKTTIVASGRSAKRLNIVDNLVNVSYCSLCDANLYKNKILALIGNGGNALDEVIYLSGIVSKLYMLVRSSNLKGEQTKIEQVKKLQNVVIIYDSIISRVNSDNKMLQSIEVNEKTIVLDGLFISIGYEPNNNFLNNIVTEKGYILTDNNMQTNIDTIYACGDIIKKEVYQLTTAVSEATIAAINIKKDLLSKFKSDTIDTIGN